MFIPKISIDHAKCPTPLLCAKCMNICPQAVFATKATAVHKFRETEDNEFVLSSPHRLACVGCNDCLNVCPSGAITIEYQEVTPKGACACE
ncbi:MAG: 4Fe-4S dicluster domain-containing protein [Bacillota bacterium]